MTLFYIAQGLFIFGVSNLSVSLTESSATLLYFIWYMEYYISGVCNIRVSLMDCSITLLYLTRTWNIILVE